MRSVCLSVLRRSTTCAAACLSLLLASPVPAVVEGVAVPDADHRFDAVGLLLTAQPWNPCGGWISGTCTLIAPDIVLVARHSVQQSDNSAPPPGGHTHRVRFRIAAGGEVRNHFAGNLSDCDGAYQEVYVREFVLNPVSGIELALGFLETPVVGIEPLGMQTDFRPAAAQPVKLAGWGYDGRCVQSGDAWTLRTAGGVLPSRVSASVCCFEYNHAGFDGECMNWPADAHWVIGNLHDSGAPLLFESSEGGGPPELRVGAIVTSYTTAQLLSGWNYGQGQPPLVSSHQRPACIAEVDGDPGITSGDVSAYIDLWFSADPRADLDGSPGVTFEDLLVYIEHYLRGC